MKKLIILFITLICVTLHAQQTKPDVVNATGGSAQYSGGYFAWSVGEPVIGTVAGSSANLNQGFLQTWPALAKHLFLTLYPEGLWNGSGLNKAQNQTGDEYPGDVADRVQVELRQAANYNQVVLTEPEVNLSTNGLVSFTVPATYTGAYYVAVKHRNSIETVSALPVALSGTTISYNFTDMASNAYGNNQKELAPGLFGLFAGDVNGDGMVNATDIEAIHADAALFNRGYLPTDVNGDGVVDALDLIPTDNNAANSVQTLHP